MMFQVIPAIGTILALAAFFFAVYYRTVQRYARIGVDIGESIGELPPRSRLDATKVLVNVFDLDVDKLAPDQQYNLALRTFEKRERESKQKFLLTLAGGAIMLLFALGYGLSQMNGGNMIKAALIADKASAESALNEQGFFSTADVRLVDRLARSAVVDRSIDDPFERTEKFVSVLKKHPTIAELRERAAMDKAPFEVAGDILNVSVPTRPDQPARYVAYVRRQSPVAGRLITVRARGRNDTYLRLYAQGAIDSDSPTDIQLNYEQFRQLYGDKPTDHKHALVLPSSETSVYDPTCPRYQGFSIQACDLDERIDADAIPSRNRG